MAFAKKWAGQKLELDKWRYDSHLHSWLTMANDVCHVWSMTHITLWYILLLLLYPVLPTNVGWDWSIVTIVLHLFRSVHHYPNTKSPETPLSYWFSSFQEAKKGKISDQLTQLFELAAVARQLKRLQRPFIRFDSGEDLTGICLGPKLRRESFKTSRHTIWFHQTWQAGRFLNWMKVRKRTYFYDF